MNRAIIDALAKANGLELYQLSLIVKRLMSDPIRIMPIRVKLRLGQTVSCVDSRPAGPEIRMRSGRVVEMRDFEVTLQDASGTWRVPYAAIDLPVSHDASDISPVHVPTPTRADFRIGDSVCFEDRHLRTQVGQIIRLNQKTASVRCDDGHDWRVGYAVLRPMIDV